MPTLERPLVGAGTFLAKWASDVMRFSAQLFLLCRHIFFLIPRSYYSRVSGNVMIILQAISQNSIESKTQFPMLKSRTVPFFFIFQPAAYPVHRTTSYGWQILHVPSAVYSGNFICALCTAASPTGRWEEPLVSLWKTFATRFCF